MIEGNKSPKTSAMNPANGRDNFTAMIKINGSGNKRVGVKLANKPKGQFGSNKERFEITTQSKTPR